MLTDAHFPLTLTFPVQAQIAVVGGQCARLEDGRIRAKFNSQEELRLCMAVVACAEQMCDLCSAAQQHTCKHNGGKLSRKKWKQSAFI